MDKQLSPKPSVARPQPAPAEEDAEAVLLELAPFGVGFVLSLAAVGVLALVAVAQPDWLTGLWTSLSGTTPKVFWYLSRASAMVGFVLLWVSMLLGLALSNKMTRIWPGGPALNALHEHTSLLGLGFGIFHALILLADPYMKYTVSQLLLPFGSLNYRPLPVGLGQLALYVLIPVTLSFYVRRWIGVKTWRTIHYLSFGVFAAVLLHGLLSGTDSANVMVLELYWISAVSVVFLTVYRVITALSRPQPALS